MYNPTDTEKQLIRTFWENESMRNAVKKHLLWNISRQVNIEEPLNHWVYTIDRTMENEKYAELIKMVSQAQSELQNAFEHLEDIATPEATVETPTEDYK